MLRAVTLPTRDTVPHVPGTREISRTKYEIARFRVTVVRGTDMPTFIESSGVELTVGSAEGNDLRLTDPAVSRHHCVLAVTPHGVELRDLDSTNGTTLAGYRVNSAFVAQGALVGVGETTLRIDLLAEKLQAPVTREDRFGPVLGTSLPMRRLFAIAAQVAPSEATILIEGETGTGKGMLAEAMHAASRRATGPFVVIDCAAMTPQLMESELFGHEQGSFTGAHQRRIGLFESAAGGTILLDEIGELPLELQPKLLRAIERHEVRRIGSTTRIAVDVRVMAATNRDLRREVNRGAFRSDLWYRLNTVRLLIPPLRERREDIRLLAAHFYQQMSPDPSARPPRELLDALTRGDWRGNVRELASAVRRAMIATDPSQLAELDPDQSNSDEAALSFRDAKDRAMGSWERQYLWKLMSRHAWNVSRAARAAHMDRSHLHDILRRHGLLNARKDTTQAEVDDESE
jgi:DNA-binding NtrC family response regulator